MIGAQKITITRIGVRAMENYSEWFARRLRDTLGDTPQTDLIVEMAENGFEMKGGRLSHYMQGRNYPDPPVLKELAKALGVSADYLLGLTEDKTPASELSEALASAKGEGRIDRLMKHMTPEQRRQVITFAEHILVQSGRADEIARSNQEGWNAAVNMLQRKFGPDINDMLEVIADTVPELRKLVGPSTKDKGVSSS